MIHYSRLPITLSIPGGGEILIGFAEAGGEGGLFPHDVQVGGIAEGTHAKIGVALLPLFRIDDGYRGGGPVLILL